MNITIHRYYLDKYLYQTSFYGKVLDVGGKKVGKRGAFRPPDEKCECWHYVNTDSSTNPDYCCNAESVPVDGGTYDNVVMCELLEHVEYPEKVLKEAARLLKQGGKIIISIPFLFPYHPDPNDFQRWTKEKIVKEMKSAGFSEINISNMGGVGSVVHDILYCSVLKMKRLRILGMA